MMDFENKVCKDVMDPIRGVARANLVKDASDILALVILPLHVWLWSLHSVQAAGVED